MLVGATGGSLGGLRSVDVGVFQVTAPNSTEVSDYGVYDTSTLDKDVTGTPVQLYEYTGLLKKSFEEAARYSLVAIAKSGYHEGHVLVAGNDF